MNKDHCNLAVKLASAVLLTGVATAEQDQDSPSYYIDSSDSLTLSMRFGLNMSGKFLGTGGSPAPYDHGALTPNGAAYNFDNGYVLTDVSGNNNNQTYYYGFDNESQVTGSRGVQQYLNLDRTARSAVGNPNDSLYDPRIGAELTYNHRLGAKDNWHHLSYGIEVAANYTPLSFSDSYVNGNVTETTSQYTYAFPSGVTAPLTAPFQGAYSGPGSGGSPYAILDVPPNGQLPTPTIISQTAGYQFIAQQNFNADLWGFRLGPYLEMPLSKRLSVHVSGGFAVGLLDANASWTETLTAPNGGGSTSTSGAGKNFDVLYGEYARLNFAYQLDRHWAAEIGAQFQDLGTYSHNFGGRTVQLDLSQSIFVEAGLTYRF